MAALSLVFDLIGRDISASKAFNDVGNAADRAGKKGEESGGLISKGMKLAGGALLGAGLIEGFKSLYEQASESAKIGRLTTQVIQSTGGAAGVTAKQVSDLATAISNKTGVDDEAIQSGENLLLTFTGIRNEVGKGNDIFNQATAIVNDMSVALGQDMKSSAIQVGKALNDPIKGVSALQRVGVSFTESQKEQIKVLVATGDQMGAQKLILGELSKEFGGAAAAAATPFQKLQVQLGNLAEQVGSFLIPVVDDFSKFLSNDILPNTTKLATFVGGVLNPALHLTGGVLGEVARIGGGIVSFFESLPGPIQATVGVMAGLVVLKGPLSTFFGTLKDIGEGVALKMLYAKDAIGGLGSAGGVAKAGLGGFMGLLGGPWGLAITGATLGLTALFSWLGKSDEATKAITQATKDYASALGQEKGAIDDNVRNAAAKAAQDAGLLAVADRLHISLPQVTDAITGQGSALEATRSALQANIEAHTHFQTAGHLVTKTLDDQGQASQNALNALNALSGQTKTSEGDAAQLARATQATGDAMAGIVPQTDEAKKALADWLKQLQQIGDGFVQPLSIYTDLLSQKQQKEQESAQATADATKNSNDSWKDYVKNVSVSLDDYATKLEEQITNQDNWRVNIGKIAQRGGLEVAQILSNMGVQGADLTAQMATATDANFQRMAGDLIRDAQNGGAGATAAFDQSMKVMAEIGKEGGSATALAVSQALGIGINDVAAVAQRYSVTLATGLEPILQGLGKPPIVVPGFVTRPGLIGRNADGGFIEGPGTGRSDSILSFLSNGEFVMNSDATAKNRPLLEALNSAPRFAGGGFVSPGDVPHPYSTAPYGALIASPSDGTMSLEYDDVTAYLKSSLFTGGGGGAGSPAIRALGQQIAAAMGYAAQFSAIDFIFSHESGWNPLAQNPTSTAYGIPQFLNSTWGAYGGKTSDPATQIRDGIMYMRDRYGSPNGAAAFWQGHHWYKDGTNFVPSDQLAMLHKGEAVVPASQNQGKPYVGGQTVQGQVFNGPVTITDTDAMASKSYRHAAMAAARFR